MSRTLLDLVRELNTLNDDNLADRVIASNDVQWCLLELQDILEAEDPTPTPQNEWVRVEERLPESIVNKVLVYCENGYIGYGHYEKYQGEETWYNLESGEPFASWNLENCSPYKVTHWMPLPNPPEREDGDVNHV